MHFPLHLLRRGCAVAAYTAIEHAEAGVQAHLRALLAGMETAGAPAPDVVLYKPLAVAASLDPTLDALDMLSREWRARSTDINSVQRM